MHCSNSTTPAIRIPCANKMKKPVSILTILGLLSLDSSAETPLECKFGGTGDQFVVEVVLTTPHPARMVVKTPSRGLIWLQDSEIPFQFPVTDDFENLAGFELDVRTKGTWFNDWSEPEVVYVIDEAGTYSLFVADKVPGKGAIESEYFCEFTVPGSGER